MALNESHDQIAKPKNRPGTADNAADNTADNAADNAEVGSADIAKGRSMTAKKKADEKSFWGKMLSAYKVKRILEKRGFDAEAFRRDYEADTNRGPRKASRPSDREIASVDGFLKSGDYVGFMHDLSTKSRPKADAVLRRVVAWKGQGGVKTIRRRANSRDE
jgi:hypothetical protein